MGLPVTVYRYTDAGAPQLTNGTPSEWVNILKKVLVEGYGSKAPLGWTLEFENTSIQSVVFRNATTDGGSGGYVKFYSVDGSNTAYKDIGIKCAIGMTEIDVYFRSLWVRVLRPSSAHNGWEVIGTKRGFYLILHNTNSTLMGLPGEWGDTQVYFVGDIHSVIANDPAQFTIVNSTNTNGDVTISGGITDYSGGNLCCQLYAIDGSNTSLTHIFSKGPWFKNNTVDGGNAESLGITHLMTPVFIYGENTQNNNISMPQGRGIVPGLFVSSFAGYRTENWPKELTQGGESFIALRSYITPQFWINTGGWYD